MADVKFASKIPAQNLAPGSRGAPQSEQNLAALTTGTGAGWLSAGAATATGAWWKEN